MIESVLHWFREWIEKDAGGTQLLAIVGACGFLYLIIYLSDKPWKKKLWRKRK